jgi:hypothetical protein
MNVKFTTAITRAATNQRFSANNGAFRNQATQSRRNGQGGGGQAGRSAQRHQVGYAVSAHVIFGLLRRGYGLLTCHQHLRKA